MSGSKKWYLSKTIWGSVAMIIGLSLRWAGYEVSEVDLNNIVDLSLSIASSSLELGGALVAIYGRAKATHVIKK